MRNVAVDQPQPFLKWAGGKRWLALSSLLPVPSSYSRYIEPFLGGGAVFFRLCPKQAILSDLNQDLINLYLVIRDKPEKFLQSMKRHHLLHDEQHYYHMRESTPKTVFQQAVRTLYLNRTCFNGLYRVNLDGKFNVPIGTKRTVVFPNENFRETAKALNQAVISCNDFATTLDLAGQGDFVFIDPPYTVQHNLNGFLKYNEKIFSWADQLRLREKTQEVVNRGATVVMTNADHESVKSLYTGFCEYRPVKRFSVLAGNSSNRGRTTEALFYANMH